MDKCVGCGWVVGWVNDGWRLVDKIESEACAAADASFPAVTVLLLAGTQPSHPTRFHPQFVFLDAEGKPLAAAVGKLPKEVLVGNTAALAAGQPLPYARVQAAGASGLQRPEGAMAGPRQAGPLDHS